MGADISRSQLPEREQCWALTLQAREEVAAKLFAVANIKKLIADRQLLGRVRVKQRQSVELRDTRAAHDLLEWLAAEGFAANWVPCGPTSDEPDIEPYHELLIGWSAQATGGAMGAMPLAKDVLAAMASTATNRKTAS